MVSGWLSDRSGKRKPFVIYGYSLSTFAKPLLALAATWHFVLASRFLDRFGKGLRTSARDALIADSTEMEYRGKAFGFHRALDTVGAVFGPLLALLLLYYLDGNYRTIFLIAFIPALISVILLVLYVSEKKGEKKPGVSFKLSEFRRDFKIFLLINIVFAIGNSSNVFLILRTKNIFESFGGIPSVITWAFGSMGITAVDLVPAEKRGTAIGLYYSVTGILALLSSIIAGLLWDYAGANAPFLFGSVAALVAAAMLVIFMPKYNH